MADYSDDEQFLDDDVDMEPHSSHSGSDDDIATATENHLHSSSDANVRSENDDGSDMDHDDTGSDGSDAVDTENPRDFFRNMNFRDRSFADVIQRLMGSGVVFARDSTEMDGLIATLTQRDNPYAMLESLNELSERLLMMNGITAERVIPVSKLVRALVDIMNDPALADELELQLVACRCLYNFLEVNQDFIHDVVASNAIECLCHKLTEISYIDLTEQALQTLEMISRDPVALPQIINHNGLKACLQYLDFLTVHSQRKCLIIVANACNNIPVSSFAMIDDVFDSIALVCANHTDNLVVENAWLSISRIVISFKTQPHLLEKLFLSKAHLLRQMTDVIIASSNKSKSSDASRVPVSFSTCLNLIKSLTILAGVSVNMSGILLAEIRVGSVIIRAINRYARAGDSHDVTSDSLNENIASEAIMAAPNELLSQFLNLIGYLLPINYGPQETPFLKNSYEEYEEKTRINTGRIQIYSDVMPDLYWAFVNDVWSFLIDNYQGTMDFEVRRKSLVCIFRIIKFCDESEYGKIKGVEMISGLLASIINQSKGIVLKQFASLSSAQDAEMQTPDPSQDSEASQMPLSQRKNEDNTNKLNSNILLLESCLIVLNLIRQAPSAFAESFEREGIIGDITLVLKALRAAKVGLDDFSEAERARSFSSNFSNKYLDVELTKDYEYKLTSDKIYNKLVHIMETINEVYAESKESSNDSGSASSLLINEVKTLLNNEEVIASYSHAKWRTLWSKLEFTFKNISSYELISSGIIECLADLFSRNEIVESTDCYAAFISVFFVSTSAEIPAKVVVSKLQEALTRTEPFEVISAGGSSGHTTSRFPLQYDNSQTAGMARQVKLKLTIENEDMRLPSSLQNMVLSVHAIATFKSIETFLKQRLSLFNQLTGNTFKAEDAIDDDQIDDEIDDNDHTDTTTEKLEEPKPMHNMEFLINGEVIPNDTTIYGAIYRSLQSEPDEIVDSTRVWNAVHSVTLRKCDGDMHAETQQILYNSSSNISELESYDETTINILRLLKILFEMNSYASKMNLSNLPDEAFMNWKLTVKLTRQLEEPLIVASGTLPGWSIHVTRQFPFIFPLETRIFFLQSTSFGYSRLINQWQVRTNQENDDNNNSNSQRPQLGRPSRHKVRISRKMMLQSAMKVLGLYGSTPGILEIEYFDEVGSGLGPTLEFYSTVSKEFCKKKLHLWRDEHLGDEDDENESYVDISAGLFPAPLDKHSDKNRTKVLYFFTMLGKFVARALLDSRIIDFQFNELFLRLVQLFNQSNEISAYELRKFVHITTLRGIDPKLAASLEHLLKYVEAYKNAREEEIPYVTVDNCSLEDLALTYTLPGYPSYELKSNGENIAVDSSNLEEYIQDVLDASLYSGVVHQVKAFMDGFSKVFPVNSLIVFSSSELVTLFGNGKEDWSYETLASAINANHGYNKDSEVIRMLIEILVDLSEVEKRQFLQFLTGAPKLPIGGFKALSPELTVVRKHAEGKLKDDDYLPSVMTCANYLKLPNYSSKAVMREKLLQAIREGAGAFHLS